MLSHCQCYCFDKGVFPTQSSLMMVHGILVCREVCHVAQYFLLHHSGFMSKGSGVERWNLQETDVSWFTVCYSPQHSWRVWCEQTHWCANSPQWSWRIWCKQTNLWTNSFHSRLRLWCEQIHWCGTHLIVLEVWCVQPCSCAAHFRVFEEFDVHRLTSTFLKSLMRADSLVSTMVMRSLRSTGTSAPLTSTPI